MKYSMTQSPLISKLLISKLLISKLFHLSLLFFFILLFLNQSGYANQLNYKNTPRYSSSSSSPWYKPLYFTAAIGPNWTIFGDTSLHVSPFQTDLLAVSHAGSQALWQVGGGARLFADDLAHRSFLNALPVELNYYNNQSNITGNVYSNYDQTANPIYYFHTPISSSRVMLDFKPWLFTFRDISPYVILGIGWSWNTLGYYETSADLTSILPRNIISLKSQQNQNTAYDVGIGISTQVTPCLTLFGEYMYSYLGAVRPQETSMTATNVLNSPIFILANSSALFGFTWNIDY